MRNELLCAATSMATWAATLLDAHRQQMPEHCQHDTFEDFRMIHRNAVFLTELISETQELSRVLNEVRYFTVAIDGYSCLLLEQPDTEITTEEEQVLTRIRDVNEKLSFQIGKLVDA